MDLQTTQLIVFFLSHPFISRCRCLSLHVGVNPGSVIRKRELLFKYFLHFYLLVFTAEEFALDLR